MAIKRRYVLIIRGSTGVSTAIVMKTGEGVRFSGTPSGFSGYRVVENDKDDEGIWVSWSWDGQKIEVKNDRFGFYPAFYTCSDHSFGVSTSLQELLDTCENLEIDDTAMAVFVRLGFFIGNDTPFKNIKALGPSSTISWEDGKCDINSREFPKNGPPYEHDRATAVVEYGKAFNRVMRKYLPEEQDRVVLPLSGGKDSRHILFTLNSHNSLPDVCASSGIHPKPYRDLLIAKELCSLLGIEHRAVKSSEGFVSMDKRKNILTSLCSDEHTWIMGLADFITRLLPRLDRNFP